MRVLHVVKNSDGASWAVNQATALVRAGIDVHVAMPKAEGRMVSAWKKTGATIHIANLLLPARHPHRFGQVKRAALRLVDEVQPDLIHSHFVTTTLALRLALGKRHKIPRVFQVAGPLHLEHWHSRQADLMTAGESDYWIGTSRCIVKHYRRYGVPGSRVFLSYASWQVGAFSGERQYYLHQRFNLAPDTKLVGNISFMYPPKYLLGQAVGLKCHEDLIDALGLVTKAVPATRGVLIGDSFGMAPWYEERLRSRARRSAGEKILMPGLFTADQVARSWPDFDCAVHIPVSENCGGVLEPLLAGVPVVASAIGGIPELIIEGVTGRLVPARSPWIVAQTVLEVLADLPRHRAMASTGRDLVKTMFDTERTTSEVHQAYSHILCGAERPAEFDSRSYLRGLQVAPGAERQGMFMPSVSAAVV